VRWSIFIAGTQFAIEEGVNLFEEIMPQLPVKTSRPPKSRLLPPDSGEAFLPDPRGGAPARSRDAFAETLAEEYVSNATNAEEMTEDARNALLSEELGGPFVEVAAEEEFADTVDETNPADTEPAPFPTAIRSPE
jgi:hypothetical protein